MKEKVKEDSSVSLAKYNLLAVSYVGFICLLIACVGIGADMASQPVVVDAHISGDVFIPEYDINVTDAEISINVSMPAFMVRNLGSGLNE